MGWIAGFIGGAADGVARVGEMELIKRAEREKAEADAVRRQALAEYEQGREDSRLEYKTGVDTEQKQLDRENAQEVAEIRSRGKGSSKSSAAKPIESEDDYGNKIFLRYDPDTDEMVEVRRGGASGAEDREPTAAELERARVDLSTAGGKDRANDWIPFNEPSKDQIYARALENRRGGGTGGTGDPLLALLQGSAGGAPQAQEKKPEKKEEPKPAKPSGMVGRAASTSTVKAAVPLPSDGESAQDFIKRNKRSLTFIAKTPGGYDQAKVKQLADWLFANRNSVNPKEQADLMDMISAMRGAAK